MSGETALEIILKEIHLLRNDVRKLREDVELLRADSQAIALTVEQASLRLGCSRTRIYELLQKGRLKRAPRVGRKTMVTVRGVETVLTEGVADPPRARKGRGVTDAQRQRVKQDILALMGRAERIKKIPI